MFKYRSKVSFLTPLFFAAIFQSARHMEYGSDRLSFVVDKILDELTIAKISFVVSGVYYLGGGGGRSPDIDEQQTQERCR